MVSFLPDKMIAAWGGRDSAARKLEEITSQMLFESIDVGEEVSIARGNIEWLAIVTTSSKVIIKDRLGIMKGYLLAVSSDRGSTWKFIEGSWSTEQEIITKYPDIAQRLVFPRRRIILGDPTSGDRDLWTFDEIDGKWLPDAETSKILNEVFKKLPK